MQQPHHQPPSGDGLEHADLITTVQTRVKRLNTATRWLDRSAQEMAKLRHELAEARLDLADACHQNAGLHQEVTFWQRNFAATAGLEAAEVPPQHYVAAVCTPQREASREVTVDIDDTPWTIGLSRDRPTDLDPLRVLQAWHQLVAGVRQARAQLAGGA